MDENRNEFIDSSNDLEIASRISTGRNQDVRTGSRYADKHVSGSGKRTTSGLDGRRRQNGQDRLFVFLRMLLGLLAIYAIGALILLHNNVKSAQNGSGSSVQDIPEVSPAAKDDTDTASQNLVDLTILDSPYSVLMAADTGEILAAHRSDEKIFPASMTKMLTVLTAIEHISDLDAAIYMSEDYYQDLYDQDASRAGFEPGERAVIRDLLYGALLPSGAECCIELARQAAGSESAFVDLMNQKVADLGLVQTHFTNCTGLHNAKQFSTPAEIAKILRAALQNQTFYDAFTTHRYSVAPTEIHPEGFTFWSTLFKNTEDEIVTGGEIIGGKTGYTDEAGHCLASAAEIYGKIYILVTAGWASDPRTELYHISDAFLAYDALGAALQ